MTSSLFEKGLLMVGAGGIGSEVAHLLMQKYTGRLVIIDMDVIELSNLNRQAFFSEKDINRYKAEVLASSVTRKSQGAIETAFFTSSITDRLFDASFFSSFGCILSCVDNIEAREHINTMAFLTNTLVIESGTSGYSGQVQITVPGTTECYACTESVPQRSFPICTLRGIPEKWHHCVHWAKYDFMARLQENLSKARQENTKHSVEECIETLITSYGLALVSADGRNTLSNLSAEIKKIDQREIEQSTEGIHIVAGIKAAKYNIEAVSIEETQEILKKTIPSVITTNTIVASIVLLQLNLLVQNKPHSVYYTSAHRPITKTRGARHPNTQCPVCSYKAHVLCTGRQDTLLSLLKTAEIQISSSTVILKDKSLVYDEEYTDLLDMPIVEIGISTGTILKVLATDTKHMLYVQIS